MVCGCGWVSQFYDVSDERFRLTRMLSGNVDPLTLPPVNIRSVRLSTPCCLVPILGIMATIPQIGTGAVGKAPLPG